jgi:ribonuclease HI
MQIIIHTDGSCYPNPGPGGWAYHIQHPDGWTREAYDHMPDTTNNRAEMTAAIRALESISEPSRIVFITDSQYLCKGFNTYMHAWVKYGWKRKGKFIPNSDLWQELYIAKAGHTTVRAWWTRGHNGNPLNERVDELAGLGRLMPKIFGQGS